MKNLLIAITAFAASIAVVPAFAQGTDKLNPGDKVPGADITLQNANGTATTLKDNMGENGLLVMFSCNTCPFVIKNQPITEKTLHIAKAHHVGVVIINSNEAQRSDADSYEAMKKYAQDHNYQVPYVLDKNSELADMFGANHTPEIYLFDKNMTLVYKGAMNDNPGDPSAAQRMYIREAIENMVVGKTPDPSVTKSIGCSIKRKS